MKRIRTRSFVVLLLVIVIAAAHRMCSADGFLFGSPMKRQLGGFRQPMNDNLWQRQRRLQQQKHQEYQQQQQQQQRYQVLDFQDVGEAFKLDIPTRYPQMYSAHITRHGKLAVENRQNGFYREWTLPDAVTREDISVNQRAGEFSVSIAKPITTSVSELDDSWQIVIASRDPNKRTNFDVYTQRNKIAVRNRRRSFYKEWDLPKGVEYDHVSLEYTDESIVVNILKPGATLVQNQSNPETPSRPKSKEKRNESERTRTPAPTRDDLLFLNTDSDLEVFDDGDWFSSELEPKDTTAVSGYVDPRGDFVSY